MPLAIIVVVGIIFYLLGGKTRQNEVEVPITAADVPAGDSR